MSLSVLNRASALRVKLITSLRSPSVFLRPGALPKINGGAMQVRMSSGRKINILPSAWATHHFWNDVQFYYLLGIIPPLVIVFIMNVLYGEAELQDIPEGYVPEWWEYHRHPITRLLAKNFCESPVRVYERELGWYYSEHEKVRFDKLARKAQRLMRENADYKAWFYVPASVQGFAQSRYNSEMPDPTRESVR